MPQDREPALPEHPPAPPARHRLEPPERIPAPVRPARGLRVQARRVRAPLVHRAPAPLVRVPRALVLQAPVLQALALQALARRAVERPRPVHRVLVRHLQARLAQARQRLEHRARRLPVPPAAQPQALANSRNSVGGTCGLTRPLHRALFPQRQPRRQMRLFNRYLPQTALCKVGQRMPLMHSLALINARPVIGATLLQ